MPAGSRRRATAAGPDATGFPVPGISPAADGGKRNQFAPLHDPASRFRRDIGIACSDGPDPSGQCSGIGQLPVAIRVAAHLALPDRSVAGQAVGHCPSTSRPAGTGNGPHGRSRMRAGMEVAFEGSSVNEYCKCLFMGAPVLHVVQRFRPVRMTGNPHHGLPSIGRTGRGAGSFRLGRAEGAMLAFPMQDIGPDAAAAMLLDHPGLPKGAKPWQPAPHDP